MDSVPPARITSAWPTMMRSAAMAIDCKPGRAEPVDGDGRNFRGQARALAGDARNVIPRFAFGHGAAEDHVLDFLGIEARDAANRFLNGDGGEVVGARGAQRALARFPDRRANGTYDDGFSHVVTRGS